MVKLTKIPKIGKFGTLLLLGKIIRRRVNKGYQEEKPLNSNTP